jgi:hypothetical protein
VGDTVLISRNISKKMKLNAAIFTTPPLALKDFDTHIVELEDAQVDTIHGGVLETEIRDQKKLVVVTDLNSLSLYVNQVSQGNAAVIRKAGMPVKKQKSAVVNAIDAPKYLQATSTVDGRVNLVWDKVSNSRSYSVEICDNITAPVWTLTVFNTRNKATVKNLLNSKTYWFRVSAVGPNNLQSAYTPPVKVTVQ